MWLWQCWSSSLFCTYRTSRSTFLCTISKATDNSLTMLSSFSICKTHQSSCSHRYYRTSIQWPSFCTENLASIPLWDFSVFGQRQEARWRLLEDCSIICNSQTHLEWPCKILCIFYCMSWSSVCHVPVRHTCIFTSVGSVNMRCYNGCTVIRYLLRD